LDVRSNQRFPNLDENTEKNADIEVAGKSDEGRSKTENVAAHLDKSKEHSKTQPPSNADSSSSKHE
jgi:hypothetical protein